MKAFSNWFVKITAWLIQWIAFRTKIYYENKHLQSRHIKGKAIIISNHLSIWDMGLMLFVFPWRTLHCVIAEIMYQKNPLFSFFLNALGGIKVERDMHDFSFVETSCKILDRGGVVEIYPEARIPKSDEPRPLEFKPSAAYIAILSGAPVIPVYTSGKYFSKERKRVIIGTPIYVRDYYNETLSEKENIANINTVLRGKIIELEQELTKRQKAEKAQ